MGVSTATIVLGTVFIARSAGADSGETERVRMTDDCHAASFNAAIGAGTCGGGGETRFEDFIGQLVENGFEANESADDWEFEEDDVHIDHGDRLRVVDEGGEFHTSTEVEEFGPGCVPELDDALGIGLPDARPIEECKDGSLFATTGVPAGGTLHVHGLEPGVHVFACLIHPWMQSVVEVRHDDH